MKRYTVSGAAAFSHTPQNLDRTARRNLGGSGSLNFDVEFAVWPNRASMLKTIELQGRRASRFGDWRPCIDWSTFHAIAGIEAGLRALLQPSA